MTDKSFDVAVIGGGPGGYVAAIECARCGKRTLLIEKDKMGGTCLNRGCIPTKALLFCTGQYEAAKRSARFGVKATVTGFDFSAAAKHRDMCSDKLRSGVEYLIKKSGCVAVCGSATVKSSSLLEVNGEEYAFKNLIIATGSVPAAPPFEVDENADIVNSDGFLKLQTLPESAVIIGGGVIGMEFATVLCEAGVSVTVIEALDRCLANMDGEISAFSTDILRKKGVSFYTGCFVQSVKKTGKKTVCTVKRGDELFEIPAGLVIAAAGRRAALDGIDTRALGLRTSRGFIVTDDRLCTDVPGIYAIGDVNGKSMLAHAASAQGKAVALNIAGGKNSACKLSSVPGCVYTHPETACVGHTEKSAREAGIETVCGVYNAAGNGKLLTSGAAEGFVKLVFEKNTKQLLGAQLACEHATDIIGELCVAISHEATAESLCETIHPHPTVCEMVLEAADIAAGRSVHSF